MNENKELELTTEQAVKAVCLDLRRYEPEPMLCAEALRIALNDASAVKRDPSRNGLWVRTAHHPRMRYLEGSALTEYICEALTRADLSLQALVGLCRRVFQTPVQARPADQTGDMRLYIDTGMDGFRCRLCGNCCRNLDYHQELNAQDVARWKAEGRDDILKWVGITRGPEERVSYGIWVIPDTNRYAPTCPFMKAGPSNDKLICAIQETKPEICRQYPATRRHALKTGCRGFKP